MISTSKQTLAERWVVDGKAQPSYLLPMIVSFFGLFCVAVGGGSLFLLGTAWGSLLAIPLIPGGLLFGVLGIFAKFKTPGTLESSVVDRDIVFATKRLAVVTTIVLVGGLIVFLCLGTLWFI